MRGTIKNLFLAGLLASTAAPALALPPLPGPADASRVDQRVPATTPVPQIENNGAVPRIFPSAEPPEASKHVTFTLKAVKFEGMHAFGEKQLADIYADSLGKTITLDKAWYFAGAVTDRYREKGYFLSRAFVPAQEVKNGTITIRVVEGYLGEVEVGGGLEKHRIVHQWVAKLKSYHPIKTAQIENALLQLNDLPGISVRAVLEPLKGKNVPEGAVKLNLVPQKGKGAGSITFDNNGSRYLGPWEGTFQYHKSLIPMQDTSVTLLGGSQLHELKYGILRQQVALFPKANLELYAGDTDTHPGYTLAPANVKSDSYILGMSFDYNFIRQREENLTGRAIFEARDTHADIFGTPLTREHVRALRVAGDYSRTDPFQGLDSLTVTGSQGLDVFDASDKGDPDLSRAGAGSNFHKVQFQFSRSQPLWQGNLELMTAASGQYASGPLFSSEQFGYGGQAFGRAYDDSEIIGDDGIAGSIELRYTGLAGWYDMVPVPYGFYDIGKIWNHGPSDLPQASGSSAGFGVRVVADPGIAANMGLAFPLTRSIAAPLYGNGKNPRYLIEISKSF